MQANWSLMLNVVFLSIILGMIVWRLKPYFIKGAKNSDINKAPLSTKAYEDLSDVILNVRKISSKADDEDLDNEAADIYHQYDYSEHSDYVEKDEAPNLGVDLNHHVSEPIPAKKNIMVFLAAQGQNIFAGYELLQTLLSCGMRFGDGGLFHRHQHASGQGPVLFSLAAATETGVFDLQNMGAMSMKGLCMFMELSGNPTIDHERFELFFQTAKQLASELNANLLDDKQKLITADVWENYEHMINHEVEFA
jgi:cell division protein ZipA